LTLILKAKNEDIVLEMPPRNLTFQSGTKVAVADVDESAVGSG